MAESVLFCPGCNEKFLVQNDLNQCPHCRQRLQTMGDAQTQVLQELPFRETHAFDSSECLGLDDDLIGEQLERYRIESLLGRGGMGRVYRATHLNLHRLCAVKVLRADLAEKDPAFVDMFMTEARSAAALVHPHVVVIHNVGCDRGLHFIEMEYVPGCSLQRLVEIEGPLDPVRATNFMVQVCSALAEAHRRNVVHRDIKPANVLVTNAGVAKLADFGLAKQVLSTNRSASVQGLAGTPYFMAPELFLGHAADTRSDVYAMGIMYFQLLAARLPFVDATVMGVRRLHAEAPIPSVDQFRADVVPESGQVIARALAKNPADRYADAAELGRDLRAVYGTIRNFEQLVADALRDTNAAWECRGNSCQVMVPLPGGRAQRVYIDDSPGATVASRIVKVYSIAAPVVEHFCRAALELSARIPHGSVAIEQVDGNPYFVLGNTYPRATCDPDEVCQSVFTLAQHADEVEYLLTVRDDH